MRYDTANIILDKQKRTTPVTLDIPPLDIGDATQAVLVFTDATRHSPDQWLAEKLLAALPLPPEKISFLCAVGMHRPSTHAEKITKLGQAIVEKYAVTDHNPADVVTIGTVDGIPVEVNRKLTEPHTFIMVMGVVEPHQYAGYSGGAKTAVIGCGGAETISRTHGPSMLDKDGVRLGAVENNPFQNFVRQAGQLIGVNLAANVVMPSEDWIASAAVGEVNDVHDTLVQHARQLYETPVPNAPYDIVIAGVDAPKAANLYQASRAATYIGLSEKPVLREGGVILVPAAMPEGAGQGTGEQNFFAILQRFGATPALIHHLREQGCQPGEQRAYMIALLLQKYHCIFVGAENPPLLKEAGLYHAETLDSALQVARKLGGGDKILHVPHALKTLPTAHTPTA